MKGVGGGRRAVLVSVSLDGGEARISIDDVIEDANPMTWRHKEHVSSKKISVENLKEMTFSEQELGDLAHFILARLSAFVERNDV